MGGEHSRVVTACCDVFAIALFKTKEWEAKNALSRLFLFAPGFASERTLQSRGIPIELGGRANHVLFAG